MILVLRSLISFSFAREDISNAQDDVWPFSSSKNTSLRVVFSTLFSVFGNVVKHGLSSLIYYIKYKRRNFNTFPDTAEFKLAQRIAFSMDNTREWNGNYRSRVVY